MGLNVICFSDIAWDFLWMRHQQLLTRFPGDWKIIYVEPPSLLAVRRKHFQSLVNDNITVIRFPTVALFDRFALLRKINDALIISWTRSFMWLYKVTSPVIVIYDPRFSCVVKRLGERLVWYEIVDDRLEFTEVPKWMKQNVDALTDESDLITVSSRYLFDKLTKRRNSDVYLVGNGVESEHFRSRGSIHVPEDLKQIRRPIVGYVGALGEWFDFALVEKLIKTYANLSVVLVGPFLGRHGKDIARLSQYPNFHALGKKSYESLPNYIREFSLCIIPFKINELTRATNPVKFYEYLASGKPVISTALPELLRFGDVAYIAEDHEHFLFCINQALREHHEARKLIKVAEENSWDGKVQVIKRLLKRYMAGE